MIRVNNVFDPMKIHNFSTVGIGVWISVRVIWFCVRFVWSDQFEFMALIMISIVLICRVFQALCLVSYSF
jgi:hypothetical protein